MSQDLVATARIHMFYTVSGHDHEVSFFCKATEVGGNWVLTDRDTGVTAIAWGDAVEQVAYGVNAILPSAVASMGAALLETRTGIMWNAVDAHTVSAQPGRGSLVPYSQATLTLRDTAFNKCRVIMLETNQALGYQLVSPTGGDANADDMIGKFISTTTDAAAPYRWMVSKSNHFLHTNSFVTFSTWTNYHLTPS